jgi:hypothetical protein
MQLNIVVGRFNLTTEVEMRRYNILVEVQHG